MILIAIGANLAAVDGSPPIVTCQRAAKAIQASLDLGSATMSRWYESEPMPPSAQPLYVNGVLRLDGQADPATLLRALQAIETAHQRQRGVPNAARTLDLDIVAMGSLVRSTPDPVLPHPRMHERAFVLQPLLDVAPDWRHPALGLSARQLLDRLPSQSLRVIGCSHLRDGARSPN